MRKHKYSVSFPINEEHNVIECESCGFAHVDPYPEDAYLSHFYTNEYEVTVDQINIREKVLSVKNFTDKRKIIDIGCGRGDLLSAFKEEGFRVYGIEPSEKNSEICVKNNLNVIQAMVNENPFGEKFDIVNLSYVLEHIKNPYDLIENISNNFLNEGGVLIIESPNDFNTLQKVYSKDEKPYWIHFPDHLNYWNFDSMEVFLNNCGYDVEYRTTGFPVELFLLLGEDYIENPEKGPVIHQKRLKFEQAFKDGINNSKLTEIYDKMAEIGIGREIRVYCVKQ